MIAATKDNFNQLLQQNSTTPTLVFIWASWCSNCNRQTSILKRLESEESGKINIYSLMADDEQELVKELRIMAVPTSLLYSNGVLVKKMTGVKSITYLLKQIEIVSQFSEEEARLNQHKGWLQRLFGR